MRASGALNSAPFPFPTFQQGCQTLQWSEAVGLGLPSRSLLTPLRKWPVSILSRGTCHTSLGQDTSSLVEEPHSHSAQPVTFQSRSAKALRTFQVASIPEPPKSKSYFLFPRLSQLIIAPCTIANLGGLDSWTGLAYCFHTSPRAGGGPRPTCSCLQGGVHREGEQEQPSQAPHTMALPLLLCARMES